MSGKKICFDCLLEISMYQKLIKGFEILAEIVAQVNLTGYFSYVR
jgi:hypothetical protein